MWKRSADLYDWLQELELEAEEQAREDSRSTRDKVKTAGSEAEGGDSEASVVKRSRPESQDEERSRDTQHIKSQ